MRNLGINIQKIQKTNENSLRVGQRDMEKGITLID